MIWLCLQAHFFDTKDQGWHFYHDEVACKEDEPPKTLKELKLRVQELLEQAIWDPTPSNVLRYQRMQKLVMDKSQKFADVWSGTLIREPDLDHTLKAPPSYYGALARRQSKQTQHQIRLKQHAKDHALFLLVSDDEASQALQKVVTDMANYRGYQLMVVNGTDVMPQWGVKRLPALVMANITTGKRKIITYGLLGADEIEERLMREA